MTSSQISCLVQKSPLLTPILRNWEGIQLKDCWLVAGSVAQTVWNKRFEQPLEFGITDIDLVYFDPDDLSARAEQEHAERIRNHFNSVPIWLDVKNEARVHLWYEEKFGFPIAPYQSVETAIATFPTTATAVGVRPKPGGMETHAPFGFDDLMDGIVRPNKALITEGIFNQKVARWLKNWPDLLVVKWSEG